MRIHTETAISLSLCERWSRNPLEGCFDFPGIERTLSTALDGGTYCRPVSATVGIRQQQTANTALDKCRKTQLRMWRSLNSNSTTFELRTFSTDSIFVEYFKRIVVECEFVEKSLFCDWFLMHSCWQTAQTNFCLKFNYLSLLNYNWMCSIIFAQWCVTLY